MTWPDPPELPPTGPCIYPVPIKSCCGALPGDECDCLAFLVETFAAAAVGPLVAYDRDSKTWEVTR